MLNRWSLQQLRIFEAVARHASYTRAAAELHLTQPAVHIQVKRLEDGVGLPLIESLGRRLYLTRAGEEVLQAARDVLGRLRGLGDTLVDMNGEVAGPLRVAAVTSAHFFLPRFLGGFVQEHPRVHPQLTVTNRARVIERLLANADDFVVMGQVPPDTDWIARAFMDNLLVVVAHPGHRLAGLADVPVAELSGERLLLREPGSGTRVATEKLFAQFRLPAQPYMELGSSEAIKQAVMAGLGISILSSTSVELEIEAGRVVLLDVTGFPLRRSWYAVSVAGKRFGLTASCFLDYLMRAGGHAAAGGPAPGSPSPSQPASTAPAGGT